MSDSDTRRPTDTPVPGETDIHVLLIDDDEAWADSMATLLERKHEAFTVTTATSSASAMDALTDDVDCLVCDYDLGVETGLDLLAEIRAEDDRPFILVTGQGDESLASDAIGQRVTDYIPKRSLGGRTDVLARRIESAVERHRTEQALARERRSKDAMLDIVTATSSREDIVREFCEHLVAEHGYELAWIGTTEQSADVVPRAVAGAEAYLDAAIDVETPPETASEPAFVAVARDESHVVSRIDEGGDADWRTAARDHGFESATATPITHDGTAFGVLAVYKSAPRFTADEVTLLEEYGRTIGYTLRSAGWKESLLSATPATIEFELTDDAVPLVAVDRHLPPESRLDVLTAVPRADTLLYVVRVRNVPAPEIRALDTALDAIDESTITRGGDSLRCELVVSGPTPESILATHGAALVDTTVRQGRAAVTVRRPAEQDYQSLVDVLRAEYPEASVRSIHAGETAAGRTPTSDLFEELTDKQQRALAMAYFNGYFERPRDHNATDVAQKLGVSRQTFTQHLRAGQRKLFAELFEADDGFDRT